MSKQQFGKAKCVDCKKPIWQYNKRCWDCKYKHMPPCPEWKKKRLKKLHTGVGNPIWKGTKVGYSALHAYIRRHKKEKKLCEHCKRVSPIDLANISKKYLRKLNDWLWLCRGCHIKYDGRKRKKDGTFC